MCMCVLMHGHYHACMVTLQCEASFLLPAVLLKYYSSFAKRVDPAVWKSLQHRFSQDRIVEDIYDGEEYHRHRGFLSHPENISLTCNSDGVAVFTSSSVELWPVWLCINELPKKER